MAHYVKSIKSKRFRNSVLALCLIAALTLSMATAPQAARAQNPAATAPAPMLQNAPSSFADLAEKLLPAVVNISSTQKITPISELEDLPQFPPGSPFEDFFEQFNEHRGPSSPMPPPASLGSGFVIDAEKGYIVTNNHVIAEAEKVRVTLHNDQTLDAEIIGFDEKTDLAVLKVDPSNAKLTAVHFGNSDVLRVGDWIVAIGNPFGLGGTVTAGIISARQRDIQSGPYDDYLQTDASINRGNSGGPMFNLSGEVIGINTAIFSPSGGSVGIGFAIPSALAKPVINQIIEYGRTRRGWLGVRIQEVTDDIADSLGLDKARGALVASITKDGPAEAAGLESGDVILEFNGHPIKEMRELPRIVAETKIESKAKLTYWREGKERTTKVKIGELEKAEENGLLTTNNRHPDTKKPGQDIPALGLTLQSITPGAREEFGLDSAIEGVLITDVDPASDAAQKGLSAGDVIIEINQQSVSAPDKVQNALDKAAEQKRGSVLLLLNHAGDVRFVALKLADAPKEKQSDDTAE